VTADWLLRLFDRAAEAKDAVLRLRRFVSIIAKVNELMALSHQLEAHIKAGDIARSRLLDALIAETLGRSTD